MPRKLVVVPHNRKSGAAKRLAEVLSDKLGYKVWRTSPDKVGRRVAFVLTEGTDKLTQMRKFEEHGVSHPEFTTDRLAAIAWIDSGHLVVCRTMLRASQGRGIVVSENKDLAEAPLYTKYFKKKKEFRVHVFNGQVIDVQEKRKRHGVEARDTHVRNLANGYVFCRDAIVEPEGLRALAVAATSSLGYQLGAVDIAYNERHNRLVVLEVNANPGMEGTTLQKYSDSIINWFKGIENGV